MFQNFVFSSSAATKWTHPHTFYDHSPHTTVIVTSSSNSPVSTQSPVTPNQTAITRYANYLRAVYANQPVAKSDKWPSTPGTVYIKLALVKQKRVSRAAADNFTRLTLQGEIDTILQAKEQIEMDDILKAEDKTRLVVVEGAPGIGKSTFVWELCRQWPNLESLKRFSLVVLLRLREEGVQTATHITDLFPCGDDPDLSRLVADEVRIQNGKGVLFVFDGFDEFPTELRNKSLVTDIISGSTNLPKATVLVTSRPSATAQLQSMFQTGIGKHIEVVGFSEKKIHDYAKSVLDKETLPSFMAYLSAYPVVKAMMYNPLNCAIVVEVYLETSESGKPIPHTQTQLYTELTLCLLSRHLSAVGDPLARKLPDRLEDIRYHDSGLYQQLKELGKLAFEGRVREEVIFKELPKGCSDLGLLVEHRALFTRKERKTFNFFHLTLQEYLAAFYVSQLQANEQRALCIERQKLKYLRIVWRFVAGLTKMQNIGWNAFQTDGVDAQDRAGTYRVEKDEVAVGSFIIMCLYEAQDAQSCKSIFGQSRVDYSHTDNSPYDAYAAGYCISVCSNTWNVALSPSEYGSELLEMLVYGLNSKSVEYSGGFIEQLVLYGCSGVREGGHLVELPHKILYYIKSLQLGECDRLDQKGLESLADYIPHLHSLTSLYIDDNPGGVGSTVKLLRALIQHRKLQKLSMRGIIIGTDDVAALSDLIQSPHGRLKELSVGHSIHLDIMNIAANVRTLPSNVFQQLVRAVLSPSSLKTLHIGVYLSLHPLDYVERISDSLSTLTFSSPADYYSPPSHDPSSLEPSSQLPSTDSLSVNTSPEQPTANLRVKGGIKLSQILRKNTSLRVLKLSIPLDRDEVQAIVQSLDDNHSLVELELSGELHYQHFSELERQALDHRVLCIDPDAF